MIEAQKTATEALISTARADLCLDFANSRYWRGTGEPTETLTTFNDVFTWLAAANALDAKTVEALKQNWRLSDSDHAETIQLREALYRIFTAIAANADPAPADIEIFNRQLTAAPARTQLVKHDGAYLWRADLKPQLPDLLAPILWTAGDMLAEPRRDRIRLCANEKCVWLFLDDSKSGTRRWCDMKACGNRAKAHRHYERKKKEKGS
ncbi:MAG: ABATE domain-containing protein [Alphaproteobacteria bacterium]|nr:ABATE domain-containing protein [Alphaproteobacteria bacterium]